MFFAMVSLMLFSYMMNKNSLLLRVRTSFGGKEFQSKQGKCVAIARRLWGLERSGANLFSACTRLLNLHCLKSLMSF